MSTGLHPHSPTRRQAPDGPSHHFFPTEDRRNRRDSLVIGIACSVIVHLLLLFGIPPSIFEIHPIELSEAGQEFEIQLVDPEPPRPQFVETNRAAPENVPDNTRNFSARDQQAANEERPDELSEDRTPARDGIDDPDAKVIAGELVPPIDGDPVQPQPEVAGTTYQEQTFNNPEQQTPLPGTQEDELAGGEGVGSARAEELPDPEPVPELVEGRPQPSDDQERIGHTSAASPERPTPAPRPRLPRALPGPVQRQTAGVSRTGDIAVDANFSRFGEYMERMVEAVSQRWHALSASRGYSESGTHVVIEFRLTRDGRIQNMITKDTSAGSLGVLLVRSAIEQGDPYGPWTEDMVQILGNDETITFRFRYW